MVYLSENIKTSYRYGEVRQDRGLGYSMPYRVHARPTRDVHTGESVCYCLEMCVPNEYELAKSGFVNYL